MVKLAEKIVADGGPFGGGDTSYEDRKNAHRLGEPMEMAIFKEKSAYILPVRPRLRVLMPFWEPMAQEVHYRWDKQVRWGEQCRWIDEEKSCFYSGFLLQRRWFPGKGYRVLYESPSGKLMLRYQKASSKTEISNTLDNYEELPNRIEVPAPWAVWYQADLIPLRGTHLPGIIGYAQKYGREVFLCELGWQDYALILTDQHEGGRVTRCVGRGRDLERSQLCSVPELGFVQTLGRSSDKRPTSWKVKGFQEGLEKLQLSPGGHAHISAVVAQVTDQVGAETFRQLLWALLLTYLDLASGAHRKTTTSWCRALCKHGYLDNEPRSEARRHSRHLLGYLAFVEVQDRSFVVDFDLLRKL